MLEEVKMVKDLKELQRFIEEKRITNVLIGNGFSLAHPALGEYYQWCEEKIIEKIDKEKFKNPEDSNSICPETFLGNVRRHALQVILTWYIEKMAEALKLTGDETKEFKNWFNKYREYKYNASDFLKNFDNIFTVNYDPLIYFESLRIINDNSNGNRCHIIDGFKVDTYKSQKDKSQKEITDALEGGKSDKKRVFYLHGSYFIQADWKEENREGELECPPLKKISFSGQSEDTVEQLFNWKEKKLPYLICEDWWKAKEILMKESTYFHFCLESLCKSEGPLLIIGMSFEKDDHILSALDKAVKKESRKIYITYRDDSDKRNIHKKIMKYDDLKKALKEESEYFVQIDENVIWKDSQNSGI
jgi:hypothetical protein